MPYDLDGRLVVGLASSALFDLRAADAVFREGGEEAYRAYQEQHLKVPLAPGVAFSFIRRLLSLNDLAEREDPLVEVIVLSRNDPETGLRVMRSGENAARDRQTVVGDPRPRVRVSLVTARDGLAIERAIRSLKSWGVSVNDGFFLGGVEKARVIKRLRPHIFFDDQLAHLNPSAGHTASVHIPFGALNTIPGPRRGLDESAEAESAD